MAKEIPKAVLKLSQTCSYKYKLILWLDFEAFMEFGENTKPKFTESLKLWKKTNIPTLARSEYRIYIADQERIIEADF